MTSAKEKLLSADPTTVRKIITVGQAKLPYPTFLYKYKHGTEPFLESLVADNELFFSSRHQFNDPMDIAFRFQARATAKERRANVISVIKANHGRYKDRQKAFKKVLTPEDEIAHYTRAATMVADKMGIFSFTETARSLLMWAHYAKDHTGICLQYYVPADWRIFQDIAPVRYSSDIVEVLPDTMQRSLFDAFRTKSPHWQYEEEWRLLYHEAAGKTRRLKPGALTAVIYGARCPPAVRENVKKLLHIRAERGLPPLKEYEVRLSKRYYHVGIFQEGAAPIATKKWHGRSDVRESVTGRWRQEQV